MHELTKLESSTKQNGKDVKYLHSTIVINVGLFFATEIADAGHVGFAEMAGVVVFNLISCSDMAAAATAAAAVRTEQRRRSVRQLRASAGSIVREG